MNSENSVSVKSVKSENSVSGNSKKLLRLREKQEEEELNKEVQVAVSGIPLFPDMESGYQSGNEDMNRNGNEQENSARGNVREGSGIVHQSSGIVCERTETDKGNSEVINQVGALIVDGDVLFALKNLKEIGQAMRGGMAGGQNGEKPTVSRNLFSPNNSNVTIKTEPGETSENQQLIPQTLSTANRSVGGIGAFGTLPTLGSPPAQRLSRGLTSPPGPARVFGNFKRHSVDTFSGQSGKKKRPNPTPGRPSVGSPAATPGRSVDNVEANLALAEAKCKIADASDIFLKKKKTTAGNTSVLFSAIKERGKEVVMFDDGPQSFYRIMAFYARGLEMVPEDTHHGRLKDDLFDFMMENLKYTQVREVLSFHLLPHTISFKSGLKLLVRNVIVLIINCN